MTGRRSSFPTTNWSRIDALDTDGFASAISELCELYWYPIYAFIRRRCGDAHQAEDLTQAFFQRVLSRQLFRAADPGKGRFRAYLLTSVRNFLISQHAFENTQRRGGQQQIVTFDSGAAEQTYIRNRSGDLSPEEEFDRAWALTLLEHAIDRLKQEHAEKDQADRFQCFAPSLRSSTLDYDSIAEQLQIDPTAARKAASRFRQRYGQFLREEIAATLSESDDLEEEISWIMSLFTQ